MNEAPTPAAMYRVLVEPRWVKVPILVSVMTRKQSHYYSNYYSSSKEFIPRILWMNLNWSTLELHQHIFELFHFYLGADPANL